ncbi:DUF5706 domain-containing protein [Streptomyces sp. ME03-5709C]|nr:DUF5706 domain-containing protein [Streptomyces sp. ME03-5709C]
MSAAETADVRAAAPAAAPSTADGEVAEQARHLLAGIRDEITRADSKAAILLGSVGLTGGALTGILAARQWDPGRLPAAGTFLWWCAVGAWVISLVMLIAAVLPRRIRSDWQPGRPLVFFADVVRAGGAEPLHRALEHTAHDPMPSLLSALVSASRIALVKHRCVLLGAVAFAVAVLTGLAAVVVG